LPFGFALSSGSKTYAAFDVSIAFVKAADGTPVGTDIPAPEALSGTAATQASFANARYFAHFKDSSTSQFRCRVYTTDLSGSNFTFAVSPATILTTASLLDPAHQQVKWGSGLSFNTNYRVVTSWEYNTGNVAMWVTPSGTPITEGST